MTKQSFSNRHIFITGGTGFVGKTLLDRFIMMIEAGQAFEVTVLSRDPEAFRRRYQFYADRPWLHFVRGSLKALPVGSEIYTDIIHAAADTHLQGQGANWIDQIVNGTRSLLDFAMAHQAKRFLNISSGAIYGKQPESVSQLNEEFSGAPPTTSITSAYGQAKRVAEQLCTIYHQEHGLETVTARCFAFIGKHIPLDGPYAAGNFIRDALFNDTLVVKGNPGTVRTYLDGEDFAEWLLCLLKNGSAGDVYNVGDDAPVTIGNLADLIQKIIAPQKKVLFEKPHDLIVATKYIPSVEKIKALGVRKNLSLDQSIIKAAEYILSHNER